MLSGLRIADGSPPGESAYVSCRRDCALRSSETTAANGYVTKTDMDMGLLEYKTTTQVHAADAYMPPKQHLMTVTPPDARSGTQAQAQAQAV